MIIDLTMYSSSMNSMLKAKTKCLKSIYSCTTIDHIKVTKILITLYLKKYKDGEGYSDLYVLLMDKRSDILKQDHSDCL
jgi:hypothetical protein